MRYGTSELHQNKTLRLFKTHSLKSSAKIPPIYIIKMIQSLKFFSHTYFCIVGDFFAVKYTCKTPP